MKAAIVSMWVALGIALPVSGTALADDAPAEAHAARSTGGSKDAPPSEASIRELLEVSHVQKIIDSMRTQVNAMSMASMKQALQDKPVSAEQQVILDDMRGKLMATISDFISWENLEPVYLHAYREAFNQGDIDGMIRFYKTPAGRAMVDKMPQVMQTSMRDPQPKLAPMQAKVQEITRETVEKLKATGKTPAPSPDPKPAPPPAQ